MTSDDDRIEYLAGDAARRAALDDEAAELDGWRTLLADPSTWEEPPADLGDRVVAAVSAERGSQWLSAPTPARRAPRRRPALLTFLGGAAAAAAIALAITLASGLGGSDGVRVALAGTELAPSASGSAKVTKTESGLRIELDASGLPRRDGRLFYQAWLRSPDGGLVPIGTFHTGNDVVLWAGVALEDFPTITVTEEEVGDQASSGRRVLVGTVGP